MTPLISFLIASIPERICISYPKLLLKLLSQIEEAEANVEVLGLFDNQKRTVGQKRNDLLGISQGEYVAFLDDDDDISNDYVQQINDAIVYNPSHPDVVIFNIENPVRKGHKIIGKYDIRIRKETSYPQAVKTGSYKSYPRHTHVWKRRLAIEHKFPKKNFGEDTVWARNISAEAKTQHKIDKVLYYYLFNYQTSATRGRKTKSARQIIAEAPSAFRSLKDLSTHKLKML